VAELNRLASAHGALEANVIFIHGLTGDPLDTWTSPARGNPIWPTWLAEDIPGVAIFTVGYEAPLRDADGGAMHPTAIANTILNRILLDDRLKTGAFILIGHSLGGLIIKYMIRRANYEKARRPEAQDFLNRVRGVAFLATPHLGADLAALGDLLRIIVRPSKAVSAMIRNDPDLKELNEGYRDLARNVSHLILTESKPLYEPIRLFGFTIVRNKKIGVIVKEDDADPGLESTPIQIAANHVEIAKPPGREGDVYVFVRELIRSIVPKELLEPAQPPVLLVPSSPPTVVDPDCFDISRIIRYAPAELIGREAELKSIDDAWAKAQAGASARPRVMTFVALGGEGKTSLVAKWAVNLAARDWEGCEAAFAWSFYSQGTREQMAASSDLFLKAALEFFGDAEMAGSAQSAYDKGKRLAQLVGEKRALLVLDGLEPLQYAPNSPMSGGLKDEGLKALLKGLAQGNRGLCVVTTRYSIPDLRAFWQGASPEIALKRLSQDAGVALLRALGVTGAQAEYESLVEDVKGHALTLNLLGSFLRDAHGGDIRKRDLVRLEEADVEEQNGHAFRAMDAYAQWFESEGEKGRRVLAMLRLLGLFDRPADAGCLGALWTAPAIEGLTEPLVAISEAQRNIVLKRLEDAGLLSVNRDASGALVSLDAHPLLREYFARELRKSKAVWELAHKRLFEYLCATTKEGDKPTLDDLQPLYQAVTHGCHAGLQREAREKVYRDRILRCAGRDSFYSAKKLGAFGSDLGAVACFFDSPWSRASDRLAPADQAWLLNEAATRLRALGRLSEALEPMRAGLENSVGQENWKAVAIHAGNLSELELTLGEVAVAVADAEACVTQADRSGDAAQCMINRTTHADALHQAGRREEAATRFAEAEAMQAEQQPAYPLLYSLPGFRYCDLRLCPAERAAWRRMAAPLPAAPLRAEGEAIQESRAAPGLLRSARNDGVETPEVLIDSCGKVSERAAQTVRWAKQENAPLLSFALEHLTLGRAALHASVLAGAEPGEACRQALRDAVDGVRRASAQEFIPRGLLTRAWLRCLDGDAAGAQDDLDESFAIAERGPMPLFLADIHLHRARLFGLSQHRPKDYPEDWGSPEADIKEARRLIEKHGYGRRREELEDAEAALRALG